METTQSTPDPWAALGGQPADAAPAPTRSETMAVSNPKGLIEPGNLPIWHRPAVQNADGSHSSEYSTSFADDNGPEVLVPTVVGGKFLTSDGKKPQEGSDTEKAMFKSAWQHYKDTGEHLGKFDNPDDADAYAGVLHNRGDGQQKDDFSDLGAQPADAATPEEKAAAQSELDKYTGGDIGSRPASRPSTSLMPQFKAPPPTRSAADAEYQKNINALPDKQSTQLIDVNATKPPETVRDVVNYQPKFRRAPVETTPLAAGGRTPEPQELSGTPTTDAQAQQHQRYSEMATAYLEAVKRRDPKATQMGVALDDYAKQAGLSLRQRQEAAEANAGFDPIHGVGQVLSGAEKIDEAKAGSEWALPGQSHAPDTDLLAEGGTQVLSGIMEAQTGSFGEALARKPLQSAIGYALGVLGGKTAQVAAKEAGASPKVQEFANTIGFFLPAEFTRMAGLRSAVRPEIDLGNKTKATFQGAVAEAFGGRVSGQVGVSPEEIRASGRVGPYSGSVRIPRPGAAKPPAGPAVESGGPPGLGGPEGPLPSPAEVSGNAQADSALAAMLASNRARDAAEQIVKGVPPAQAVASVQPPAPPAPPTLPKPEGMDQSELRPEVVAALAKYISDAPASERAQLTMQAHEQVTNWITQTGKIIGPDGQVHIVKNPEQAAQLAAKFVNDAVANADTERDAAAKAPQKPVVKPGETPEALQPAPAEDPQERLYQRARTIIAASENAKHIDNPVGQVLLIGEIGKKLGVSPEDAHQLIQRYRQDETAAKLPTVGSPEEPVIEEDRETVDAQIEALKAGTIPLVMIPKGSKYIPATPPGFVRMDADKGKGAGTYIYDQAKVQAKQIREAALHGTHGDLLGHIQDKPTLAKAPATVIVQASKPDGTPIQDSEVAADDPEAIKRQSDILRARHPGAIITVKSPEQVGTERIASQHGGDDFSDLGAQPAEITGGKGGHGESPEPAEGQGTAPQPLPKELAGAKPRYGYRDANYTVKFEDPRDLAAYTLGQKTENKRHGEYLKYWQSQFKGQPESFQNTHIEAVRNAIKEMAKQAHGEGIKSGDIELHSVADKLLQSTPNAKPASGLHTLRLTGNGNAKVLDSQGNTVKQGSEKEMRAEVERLNAQPEPKAPTYKPKVKEESAAGETIAGHYGKDTRLLTPSQKFDSKYKLIEADDAITSHHPLNFKEDPDYPTGVQERDYANSKEAQARVIDQEQNHDPAYTINTNPDAVNGPSIITPDGVVLGGNSRAMSIMRLYHNEGADNVYRKALREAAADFGFTPEQVDAMKHPLLVREIARPSSDEEMRRIGSELNKDMKGALGVTEKAVSAGKNLTVETLEKVAEMLEAMGDGTTLRKLMGERGNDILKMFVKDGAITDRERPQFMDAKGLSEEGKTFVERAIMGWVVDDSKLMDATPKGILNKLETSLGSLARVGTRDDEWNFLPVVRAALGEHADIAARGITVEDHLDQGGMFAGPRNPVVDAIVRKLAEGQKAVRGAFRAFASDSEQDVPGQVRLLGPDVSAFDAFNHAFGTTLSESEFNDGLLRAEGRITEESAGAAQAGTQGDKGVSGAPASNAGAKGAGVPETKPDGPDAGRVEKPTKFEYGNTQADIPAGSDAAKALAVVRSRIDKADLAPSSHGGNDDGLEDQPHITLRYGLKGDDIEGIRAFLEKQSPFEAKLGRTDAFPPSKSSDGAAPIIAPIESADLHRIEAELDKHGDFIDRTFPEYKPHATVAYVKPEAVAKYKGMTETEGKTFTVRSISISKRDGSTITVQLGGDSRIVIREPRTGATTHIDTAEKPTIKQGDRVKGIDKDGVEREGTVAHSNALKTRIRDDKGHEHTLSTKTVSAEPAQGADSLDTWFGASKVVDANGKPLLVHHQTWNVIDKFDRLYNTRKGQKANADDVNQVGIWFTDLADLGKYGPRNVDAYLKIEHPLTFEDDSPAFEHSAYQQFIGFVKESGGVDGARAELEKAGHDGIYFKNAEVDHERQNIWVALHPEQVRIEKQSVTKPDLIRQAEDYAAKSKPKATDLTTHLYDQITAGEMPTDNLKLRIIVRKFDGQPVSDARMKEAQEALEAAIVRRARDIVFEGKDQKGTFDALVELYKSQPLLNVRTTTSINNQAYSTPAPLAFAASQLAGIGKDTFTYEPTAGNGMLLIGADPKNTRANELNPERAAALKAQGFQVTEKDATRTDVIPPRIADSVIANPPFGSVKENEKPVKVSVDGYKIGQIDHLIAARALDAMKDDGRATLILGADKVTGGQSEDSRLFFNWLYSHYHVVSHFEVDGKLYGRQGAGWPVRVITVSGRELSKQIAPKADSIERVDTWEGVNDRLNQGLEAAGQTGRLVRPVERPPRDDSGAISLPAGEPLARPDSPRPEGSGGGSHVIRGSLPRPVRNSDDRQPGALGGADSSVRPDADVPRSDRLEKDRPEPSPRQERPPVARGDLRNDPLVSADNEFQVQYTPASSKKDEGVLIPTNMRTPLNRAMRSLEDAVGDIDEFARKELGYDSIEEMHDALMGLQVDSVAAAIYQVKRGKAVIIGDQTGIGKGRQAAAVLRWALKNGKTPVFITAAPELFSDMYGDLLDIGSKDFQPFLMNKDEWITKPDGSHAFANNKNQHSATLSNIVDSGKLPPGRNAMFATYSQVNVANKQRDVLRALAADAVVVLDESHKAGGESSTGLFMRDLLKLVHGVTYLSATYAKRPDNMPLYFKTDISEAIDDKKTIMAAMEAGGLPLQTVVSANLVAGGQFFRRERSYDGVEILATVDTKNRAEHEQMSDEATTALRAIVKADNAFHTTYFEHLQEELAAAGEGHTALDSAGNQASKSVNHTEFSSVVHNFVRQMLFGIKAETAAQDAIDAIKRGEKPLIAVDNTMGSFLGAYVGENAVAQGALLKDFDYRTVLSRALARTRVVIMKDEMGNETKPHISLAQLDPETQKVYREAQEAIDKLAIKLPVSPIDWIRQRITDAGHTVAEITGRNLRVDYKDEVNPRLSMVPLEEQNDKVLTTKRFNDGRLDAIILNVSGSTGISLHASERFTDQRQRHMIVAQPAQDINVFMQMLGRIHRTGQVRLPRYTMLSADLPSEKRPTALLSKKMKSLNANTSSNTESATSVKVADMLNKYGDEVVLAYLKDNVRLKRALNLQTAVDGNAPYEIARKATGRMALMTVKEQHAFYNDVESAYNDHIAYLNETGQNELEPRTLDFDARETKSQVMYEGKKPGTPFGDDAIYGEYSIKSQGKPLTPEEVTGKITESLGGKTGAAHAEAMIATLQKQYDAYQDELRAAHQNAADLTELMTATRAEGTAERAIAFIRTHPVGSTMRIQINDELFNAAITDLQSTHKGTGNPFSLSKIRVRVATTGPMRFLSVPSTQFRTIEVMPLHDSPARLFNMANRGEVRDTAKIITGNLLGAYGELQGVRGSIINFTKADGTVEQGILLPRTFDAATNTRGDYRMDSAKDVAKFLRKSKSKDLDTIGLVSRDGNVRVVQDGNRLSIVTPKSKARGGEFFLDKKLTAITGDFVSRGNTMRAQLTSANEEQAISALMDKTAIYAPPGMAEEARSMSSRKPDKPDDDGITYRHAGIPLTPEMLKRAAPGVHAFLSDKADKIGEARALHEGLYDLDSQDEADVLRAMRMVKAMPGTAADEREIYHAIEDPALPLTDEQRDIRERYIDPIRYDAAEIRRRLNGAGLPVADFNTSTYNHRIVKDRGGLLDRVLHGETKGSGGGGNKLNKRASSTKRRTMMALESDKGLRRVVSIKNGRVTAWHDKVSQDLGPMRTKDEKRSPLLDEFGPEDSGQVFIDKTGREWKITQATTKEIEANTILRYHQNAMLSAVTDWLELRRHERALDFLMEFKMQPQFAKIGINPKHVTETPKGWQPTKLQLFRGYYFEPRTAEVLDWYAERMARGEPNMVEKVNGWLTASIFINPLIHTPNLLMHWITEKGVTGWANPMTKGRQYRAMVKAIYAVAKRNDDFLAALDAGGALQSQRFETAHFAKALMNAMGDHLEKDEDARTKLAAALGYLNPLHMLEAMKDFSSKVTWYSNDLLYLQAAYEKELAGMPLQTALREAGKHIPDYRLPTRIFDSRILGKIMSNRLLTVFSAYHYGMLRSYGKLAKSLVGAEGNYDSGTTNAKGEPTNEAGRTREQEKRHAFDILAMFAVMGVLVLPLIDELLKKITGNPDAGLRRAGSLSAPYDAYMVAKGEMTIPDAIQRIITPAIGTKALGEVLLNKDIRTGKRIYNPGDSWGDIAQEVTGRVSQSFGPSNEYQRASRNGALKAGLSLLSVGFHKHGGLRAAQLIASEKAGSRAMSPEDSAKYEARQEALDAFHAGDTAAAQKIMSDAGLTTIQRRNLTRAAMGDELIARVHNFSVAEVRRVMEHADEDERRRLEPILRQKIARAHHHGQKVPSDGDD